MLIPPRLAPAGRRYDRRKCAFRALSALPLLAVALAGCGGGSSSSAVELENHTASTGGKALVLTASTDEKLVQQGSNLVLALKGIDTEKPGASYEQPDYTAQAQCTASPCEWTVVPDKASTYEFKAYVVDAESQEESGSSDPVAAEWTAPARPEDFTFLINGKSYPLTPVAEGIDEYLPVPTGAMQVKATWNGDAAGTGYSIVLTNGRQVNETCSTGTSCAVPQDVPIDSEQEMNWHLQVVTAQGGKPVEAFQVCLIGSGDGLAATIEPTMPCSVVAHRAVGLVALRVQLDSQDGALAGAMAVSSSRPLPSTSKT